MKRNPLSTDNRIVRLHGAFEVENFGDILLMRIFADWVRRAGWEPCVADAPQYLRRELELDSNPDVRPSALLMVGGGYLGEPARSLLGRWRWGFTLMRRHLTVLETARTQGMPYAIVGVGFGPITNVHARWKTHSALRASRLTVLRDIESANLAAQYGVHVHAVSADAAVNLPDMPLRAAVWDEYERIRSLAHGRQVIAVQFDQDASAGDEWRTMFECLNKCMSDKNFFVLGISDQAGTSNSERHRSAAVAFLERFQHTLFEPYSGIDSLVGRLFAADLVITTKLHIGIVASASGRPVLSLPTHQKTIRFYRQLGRPDLCVPKSDWSFESIASAFQRAHILIGERLVVPQSLRSAASANEAYVKLFLDSLR